MDATNRANASGPNLTPCPSASELTAWFSVPGDMDDFIFYDEPVSAWEEPTQQ